VILVHLLDQRREGLASGAPTGADGTVHVAGPTVAVSVPAQTRRPVGVRNAAPWQVSTPFASGETQPRV